MSDVPCTFVFCDLKVFHFLFNIHGRTHSIFLPCKAREHFIPGCMFPSPKPEEVMMKTALKASTLFSHADFFLVVMVVCEMPFPSFYAWGRKKMLQSSFEFMLGKEKHTLFFAPLCKGLELSFPFCNNDVASPFSQFWRIKPTPSFTKNSSVKRNPFQKWLKRLLFWRWLSSK